MVAIVSLPVPSQNQGFLRRPAEKFNYPNSIVLTALSALRNFLFLQIWLLLGASASSLTTLRQLPVPYTILPLYCFSWWTCMHLSIAFSPTIHVLEGFIPYRDDNVDFHSHKVRLKSYSTIVVDLEVNHFA